jgi:hypothetical protein
MPLCRTHRLARATIQLAALIGIPYGSIFEVKGRDMEVLDSNELFEDIELPQGASDPSSGREPPLSGQVSSQVYVSAGLSTMPTWDSGDPSSALDNRDFHDTNTAQRLKPEEIKEMRNKGASGQEIIQVGRRIDASLSISLGRFRLTQTERQLLDDLSNGHLTGPGGGLANLRQED